MIAAQAVTVYNCELWLRGQTLYCYDYQKLVNTQGKTIKGMFRSASERIVVMGARLRPAVSLLNNRQRRYEYRLLVAPRTQPTREILPVKLREGGGFGAALGSYQTTIKTGRNPPPAEDKRHPGYAGHRL